LNAPSPVLLADHPACCDDETWKPIPDWPHESSTCGQVRSVDRIDPSGMLRLGQMLPQHPDQEKGYCYVNLLDGERRRKVHVAVAVLEAHRGLKPTPGHEACHRYGIPRDNHLDGLYWGTKAQNRADREQHRLEKAVTDSPENDLKRHRPQVRGGVVSSAHLSRPSVTRQGLIDTGSFPFPLNFPSHSMFVNPLVRTFRTSFQSLRNRKAA
jgi:hypothetical protein